MKNDAKNQAPDVTIGAMAVEETTAKITNWWFWGVVLGSLALLMVACTQYAAAMFDYQPALGRPLFSFGPVEAPYFSFYKPGAHFGWAIKFFKIKETAEVWRNVMLLSACWAAAMTIGVTVYAFTHKPKIAPKFSVLHGSAKFASWADVELTGLLKNTFPMKLRELGRLSWIAGGILPGDRIAAKAKVSKMLAEEKAQQAAWKADIAAGKTVDKLPFNSSASWRKMEAERLAEIRKAKNAVVVGGLRDPCTNKLFPLLDSAGLHIMCLAPSGRGKGVSIILPSLFTYTESMVVHDVKDENYQLSSGFRHKVLGQRILRVAPLSGDGSSARFNVLTELRVGTRLEIKDIDVMGLILCDPTGQQLANPTTSHWVKSGLDLLRGAVLHVLYTVENPNMGDVLTLLAGRPGQTLAEMCEEIASADHALGRDFYWTTDPRTQARITTHPNVRESFMRLLTKGDQERGGVKSTLDGSLNFFADPIVRDNTACSDFTIDDLTNGPVPTTLYLVAPPSETDKSGPFFSMLLNIMLNRQTEKMEYEDGKAARANKFETCYLLDEFASLSPISLIIRAMSFTRSYGVRFFLILQSPAQLDALYKKEGREAMFSNSNTQIVMTPNDPDTAKTISAALGEMTIVETNQSFSGDRISPSLKSTSVSVQKTKRALLDPAEVRKIPARKLIVFSTGDEPANIWADKFFFYEDEVFNNWAKLPALPESERIREAIAGIDPVKFPRVHADLPEPGSRKRISIEDIPVIADDELEEAFSVPVSVEDLAESGKSLEEFLGIEPADEAHEGGDASPDDDELMSLISDEDAGGAPAEEGGGPADGAPFDDDGFESLFKIRKVLL